MHRSSLTGKWILVFGILPVVGFFLASPAVADQCSLRDAKGVYAGTFTGFITASPNPAFVGPYAAIARISCDGKGTCAGSGTQSFNGTVVPLVDTGNDAVTVNADCTGTITVNLPGPPFALHFNVVQSQDGKEIWSIQTDPGTVITGHVQRIKIIPD